jgi:hypothetical protein
MPAMTQREQDLLHRYRRFYLDLVEAGGCPGPTPSGVSLRLPRGPAAGDEARAPVGAVAADGAGQERPGGQAADRAGRVPRPAGGNRPRGRPPVESC